VFFNKHNTARIASCRFIIFYTIFSFSMYPAVHMYSVHWCCRVLKETPLGYPTSFPRSVAAAISILWKLLFVLVVFALVSVSFICVCSCVGLLYAQIIIYLCLCSLLISLLCFGSRTWCSEYRKLWPSTRIVCGRCSLFRDCRTDFG